MKIRKINEVSQLINLLSTKKHICLYGAGFYLQEFIREVGAINPEYLSKIECVMVSSMEGNPGRIRNIPVRYWRDVTLSEEYYVLLTLGSRFFDEVTRLLQDTGANIIRLSFDMFQEKPYREIYEKIRPFIEGFPHNLTGLNKPDFDRVGANRAWTCWWQGEAAAPDIVKACWNSQRKSLPKEIEQVIITKDNYLHYITLPECVIDKVEHGQISLIHLSDIIRSVLLYKYGGLWLDSTLLITEPIPKDIFNYPFYTRNMPETQYCTKTMWANWFMYTVPGNRMFEFVSEAFFYYLRVNDTIHYYFTLDCMMAIVCNLFPEVEKQLMEVPYNNEGGFELGKHLKESFDLDKYKAYISKSYIHKVTYKVSWKEHEMKEYTVYGYILKQFLNNYNNK